MTVSEYVPYNINLNVRRLLLVLHHILLLLGCFVVWQLDENARSEAATRGEMSHSNVDSFLQVQHPVASCCCLECGPTASTLQPTLPRCRTATPTCQASPAEPHDCDSKHNTTPYLQLHAALTHSPELNSLPLSVLSIVLRTSYSYMRWAYCDQTIDSLTAWFLFCHGFVRDRREAGDTRGA